MTDKEEIIIDGVDVSKCRYFLKDTEGQDYNTDEFVKGCCEAKGSCIGYDFAGYGLCRGDKDCYFKQLARKTQECEELKKQLKTSEKWRINAESLNEKFDIKNTRYRKALEEIKEIVKDWYRNEWSCYMCRKNMDKKLKYILDIINKIRGEVQ